jgi:FkbM family methyltransferase
MPIAKHAKRRLRSIWSRARLKLNIYARGRHRVVSLDGCEFDLSGMPDNAMKLELLTGRYELPERNAARKYIQPEWPVVELGGCVGVVACITNKRLQHPHAHVVVEANPLAVPYLQANRDANRSSFKILNRALAYRSENVTFTPTLDFWGNSVDHVGGRLSPVTVPATRLSLILQEEKFEKFALICDIEGYEYELVMREPEALSNAAVIIMEVHPHMLGEEKVARIMSRLADLGFKVLDRSALVVVLSKL